MCNCLLTSTLVKASLLATALAMTTSCQTAEQRKAQLLFNEGEYVEAEEAFSNVLESDPENASAQAGQSLSRKRALRATLDAASSARMSGNPQVARDLLEKALSMNREWPKSADARVACS